MRGLILAVQFLTRIPTPQVRDFAPEQLAQSARWFPVVGALVGAIVAAACVAGARVDPWLGALAGTVAWIAVTGALHLDGLADLADALGASHRGRERFLEVLHDPRIGSFGAIALVVAIAAKLVLLAVLLRGRPDLAGLAADLALIAAWARFGAVLWSRSLPPLAPGMAERFVWRTSRFELWAWAIVLGLAGGALGRYAVTLAAPLALGAWWLYLRYRVGGMSGDCLGAGVEATEIALLAVLVVAGAQ
jgi:adenosylcobinamide-GDP ribazoletransferase